MTRRIRPDTVDKPLRKIVVKVRRADNLDFRPLDERRSARNLRAADEHFDSSAPFGRRIGKPDGHGVIHRRELRGVGYVRAVDLQVGRGGVVHLLPARIPPDEPVAVVCNRDRSRCAALCLSPCRIGCHASTAPGIHRQQWQIVEIGDERNVFAYSDRPRRICIAITPRSECVVGVWGRSYGHTCVCINGLGCEISRPMPVR